MALLSDDKLLDKFNRDRSRSLENTREQRQLWEEWFNFYHGKQWPEAQRNALIADSRPAVTINRTQPYIKTIIGNIMPTVAEPKYLPREASDGGLNDMMQSAAAWVRYAANSSIMEFKAAKDMIICGLGVTNERISYDDNPDGSVVKERIYPLEIGWDTNAKEINLLDANYVFWAKETPNDEIESVFDVEKGEFCGCDDYAEDSIFYGRSRLGRVDKDTSIVYEYQYRQREERFRFENLMYGITEAQLAQAAVGKAVAGDEAGANNIIELYKIFNEFSEYADLSPQDEMWIVDKKQMSSIKKELESIGVELEFQKITQWAYYRAFISKGKVLEHTKNPLPNQFSFKFMTGDLDECRNIYYGLIAVMMEPAMYANKALSQMLHIITVNPKGGVLYEKSAVDDPDHFAQLYAQSSSVISVADGAISGGRIRDKAVPQLPTGYEQILQLSVGGLREVTGVNLELMGMRAANQPGVLEAQRIQQALTVLQDVVQSLRLYMRETGRATIEFVRELAEAVPGRLVRVIGKEEAMYQPLLMDSLADDYDIIVEAGPASTDREREDFSSLIELLRTGAVSPGLAYMKAIIDKSPIREELKQEILDEMQAASQPDPSTQQIQMLKVQLDLEKQKSEVLKNQADAALKMAQAGEKSQEVQATKMVTGISPVPM